MAVWMVTQLGWPSKRPFCAKLSMRRPGWPRHAKLVFTRVGSNHFAENGVETSAFACMCVPAEHETVRGCRMGALANVRQKLWARKERCHYHFVLLGLWVVRIHKLLSWLQKMCLARTKHACGHESRNWQTKRIMQAEQKKMSKQTLNPLRNIDLGRCSKRQGTNDSRDVHPSLGNGPQQRPKENSRCSCRRLPSSYLYDSTPTISEHNPKFPATERLPDGLLSALFSPTAMTWTDGLHPQQPRLITQSKWRTKLHTST